MEKSDFREGQRVRVTEGYLDGIADDDEARDEVGRKGNVTANFPSSRYIRVQIDGRDAADLYLPHELEDIGPEYPTVDEVASTLYDLVVHKGRRGGRPPFSDLLGDGTFEALPEGFKESWREGAERFAREWSMNLSK